jgi:16S rRNA (guanine(966)-N(2))-methyltransferase RsmD
VRIISGKHRGKQIRPPKNFRARPTTDFAKESLFNILLNHYVLEEVEALDLFAGTGGITYEFASRGTREVTTLELDPAHHAFIRKTLQELEMDRVNLLRADAFRYLKKPARNFDIVFADPPYDHPELEELPTLVFSGNLVAPGGVFILEHPARNDFSAHPRFRQERKYGGVCFTFFSEP